MQAMLSKQNTDTTVNRLFKRIAELTGEGFDTVVHVGAGAGTELYDYQRLGFERLVLVEGDADSAEELRASIHDRYGAEVIEQVVAPETGPATWHRYNLPALNSVLPAGSLSTLYPRLKVMGRERVQAVSLQELLKRAALNPAGGNLLFLDVPGTEDALLANVPEDLLYAFEWIAVRGSQCAYYERSAEIDAPVARLKQHGFRLEALDCEIDFEWPVALLQRDNALLESRKLRAKIADLTATIEAYAGSEQARQAELTAVSAERDEHARLADEREKQAQALTLERTQLVEQLAESQAELKAVTEANAAQQRLVTEQQGRIETLSQERDEKAKLAADRHTQIQQSERTLTECNAQLTATTQELVEARQTASLSVKLQMLREADLRDLQNRYRESISIQERQHLLLTQLGERLSLASTYFHALVEGEMLPAPRSGTERLTHSESRQQGRRRAGRKARRAPQSKV